MRATSGWNWRGFTMIRRCPPNSDRQWNAERAVTSAINAYLRAGDAPLQASVLQLMAEALETAGSRCAT